MYKKIINESFSSVFNKKYILMKALFIPFLILMLFEYLSIENKGSMIISIIVVLISFLISITIAITTHRVLLIKENAVPPWGLYKFGAREFKFLFYSFLLALFIMIPSFALAFIPYAGFLALPLIIILFSRLSLVFPSIAVDEDIEFKEAWNYTKNYKLLTIVTVILVPIFIGIIISLVYGLVIGYLVGVISSKLSILYSVLNIFVTVFMISCLSSTYKNIKEEIFKNEDQKIKEKVPLISEEYLNEDTYKLTISKEINEDFDFIKEYLQNQYEELGFSKVVIDKDDSFMLKNEQFDKSYVCLSLIEEFYVIEVFNSAKPYLDFLEKYEA